MIKAVFFDVDGTLVDSDKPIVQALRKAFAEAGLRKPTGRQVLRFAGYPLVDWVDFLFRELRIKKSPFPIAQSALRYLHVYYRNHSPVMPGTRKMLLTLKNRGVKLVIVSNGPKRNIIAGLKRIGLIRFFDRVVGSGEMNGRPKPEPHSLLRLLRIFKLRKRDALFVGDTEIDAVYAHSAGVKFALLCNYRNEEVHADFKLKRLVDLLKVVKGG